MTLESVEGKCFHSCSSLPQCVPQCVQHFFHSRVWAAWFCESCFSASAIQAQDRVDSTNGLFASIRGRSASSSMSKSDDDKSATGSAMIDAMNDLEQEAELSGEASPCKRRVKSEVALSQPDQRPIASSQPVQAPTSQKRSARHLEETAAVLGLETASQTLAKLRRVEQGKVRIVHTECVLCRCNSGDLDPVCAADQSVPPFAECMVATQEGPDRRVGTKILMRWRRLCAKLRRN